MCEAYLRTWLQIIRDGFKRTQSEEYSERPLPGLIQLQQSSAFCRMLSAVEMRGLMSSS